MTSQQMFRSFNFKFLGCKISKEERELAEEADQGVEDDKEGYLNADRPPPYGRGQEWNEMQPVTKGYSAY
jgi:hypothetical protein